MLFFKRKAASPPGTVEQRLKQLVLAERERGPAPRLSDEEAHGVATDATDLLVELRAALKRGTEPAAARKLGSEFSRYLGEFVKLGSELQSSIIEALLRSRQREQQGDLDGAVQVCADALEACAGFPSLLERLARLEAARGQRERAERWYSQLLAQLDLQGLEGPALEVARTCAAAQPTDLELLRLCAQRLEAGGETELGARCWRRKAELLLAAERPAEALTALDRALALLPDDAGLHLDLALVYERLGEVDRAALAFGQAEALAYDDPETLARVLILQARSARPEEGPLGRLMDLLDVAPAARAPVLERCAAAMREAPYNPHLGYLYGVLAAQAGQLAEAGAMLRIAVERYAAQCDAAGELEARLALQQVQPLDEQNRRRVAELHFQRGEVKLAMQALADLARVAREQPTARR